MKLKHVFIIYILMFVAMLGTYKYLSNSLNNAKEKALEAYNKAEEAYERLKSPQYTEIDTTSLILASEAIEQFIENFPSENLALDDFYVFDYDDHILGIQANSSGKPQKVEVALKSITLIVVINDEGSYSIPKHTYCIKGINADDTEIEETEIVVRGNVLSPPDKDKNSSDSEQITIRTVKT